METGRDRYQRPLVERWPQHEFDRANETALAGGIRAEHQVDAGRERLHRKRFVDTRETHNRQLFEEEWLRHDDVSR